MAHIQDSPLEGLENKAKCFRDVLIHRGGRPTRDIRYHPIVRANGSNEYITVVDPEAELESTVLKGDLYYHHWKQECNKFEGELRHWEDFLDYQRRFDEHPELVDVWFDVASSNLPLRNHSIHLSSWREYEAWLQLKIKCAIEEKESCRSQFVIMQQNGMKEEEDDDEHSVHYSTLRQMLADIQRNSHDLTRLTEHLAWTKGQYYRILKTAVETLLPERDDPDLLWTLEVRMQAQADNTYKVLENAGVKCGQPRYRSYPIPDLTERLYDLSLDISRLLEEKRGWDDFVKGRETLPETTAEIQNQHDYQESSRTRLLVEYADYRRRGLENTQKQERSWQDILAFGQQMINKGMGWLDEDDEDDLDSHGIEDLRLQVHMSCQATRDARTQLEKAQSNLADISIPETATDQSNRPRKGDHESLQLSDIPVVQGSSTHNDDHDRGKTESTGNVVGSQEASATTNQVNLSSKKRKQSIEDMDADDGSQQTDQSLDLQPRKKYARAAKGHRQAVAAELVRIPDPPAEIRGEAVIAEAVRVPDPPVEITMEAETVVRPGPESKNERGKAVRKARSGKGQAAKAATAPTRRSKRLMKMDGKDDRSPILGPEAGGIKKARGKGKKKKQEGKGRKGDGIWPS